MTSPQPQATADGMLAQILLKQGEMGTQLAVIVEQLKTIPDHESRIRALETSVIGFKSKVFGAAAAVSLFVSAGGTWLGLVITHK